MTFSEYFIGLFPYLSDSTKQEDFFDAIIGHFICDEVLDTCEILNRDPDTKKRYVKENNPNKISKKHAQFLYTHRDLKKYSNWLYEQIDKTDTFDKIELWLVANNIVLNDASKDCANLLEEIIHAIITPAISAEPPVHLPPANSADTKSNEYSDADKALLHEFNLDYDEIVEKCISENFAQEMLDKTIQIRIMVLFNDKWKTKSGQFQDIMLKSNVLALLGKLDELSSALDPKTNSPHIPIRLIRRNLRNLYIKLHPSNYSCAFPYDVFIEDWNEGENY